MKKQLIIIGLIILSVFVYALPEIKITENASKITNVELKLYNFNMDEFGHIKNYSIVESRTKKVVELFEYANDSFDLINPETKMEILPVRSEYNISEDKKYVEFTFFFKNGGYKKYKFYNDTYFHFDIEFDNVKGLVKIPTISYADKIRTSKNQLVSYLPKPYSAKVSLKSVLVFSTNKKIEDGLLYNVSGNSISKVYMGPMKLTFIKSVFDDETNKSIKALLQDVGALNWSSNIYYFFVDFLYMLKQWTGNFGWAIIIFTLIIRVILYPLYHKQMKSMIMMKQLQPEIEKLKKKYSNPQKQQEAMMNLYKEKGYNPASGCLPLLVQMPVFFLLYSVIYYFGESFAYNPKFLFWSDLSQGGFSQNIILVLVTSLAYIVTGLWSANDAKMAWQQIIMSVVFQFMFIGFPTGLFIYYTTTALIQVVLTYITHKRYGIKGITLRELFGLGPKPIKRKA
ncbi:membrane protein insertase YidC [Tepiditoga spiralis]|uniref:Membrane protein insertase YidC n=1 Tax=Tepiditoga spiralis TaxID=2108365 RepID=A0A7G1G2F2_9BACT|nr:membrane protein insertase YidC [Tepiditoga spiralis]BBE30035.1 membrane protein insertase YidC [Tepiditoga spiralis]